MRYKPFKKIDGFKYNYNERELSDIKNHFYKDRKLQITQNQSMEIGYDHFNKIICFSVNTGIEIIQNYIHLDDLQMVLKYLSEER